MAELPPEQLQVLWMLIEQATRSRSPVASTREFAALAKSVLNMRMAKP
jgi:hypothetical protein